MNDILRIARLRIALQRASRAGNSEGNHVDIGDYDDHGNHDDHDDHFDHLDHDDYNIFKEAGGCTVYTLPRRSLRMMNH